MEVKVINKSSNNLPKYATPASSGVDLYAEINEKVVNKDFLFNADLHYSGIANGWEITIQPGGRALIPTELFTAIPEGYEVQIRPRSGLALKQGVTVLNAPGTIDADYRNGWGVILANFGTKPFNIVSGDRIAQAVLMKVEKIDWKEVISLDDTERGFGGFGHTGTK